MSSVVALLETVLSCNYSGVQSGVTAADALLTSFAGKKYPSPQIANGATANIQAELNKLKADMGALTRTQHKVRLDLDTSGIDAKLRSLEGRMNGLGRIGGNGGYGGFGSTTGYFAYAQGQMLTSSLTMPVVNGAAAVVKAGAAMDASLKQTSALTNVAEKDLDRVRKRILEMSSDPRIRKGPLDIADGFYQAASVIDDTDKALTVVQDSLIGVSAGLGNTKQVTDTVTGAMAAFNIPAEKATTIIDKIVAGVRLGKAEGSEFAGALSKVSANAALAGVSLDETIAGIATMTRLNIPAKTAGIFYSALLLSIVDPASKARKELDSVGLSVEKLSAQLKTGGTLSVLKDIFDATKGDLGKVSTILPNDRALRGAAATYGVQADAYRQILSDVNNSQGAGLDAAATATDTFNVKLDKLKATVQRISIELSDALLPALSDVADALDQRLPGAVDTFGNAWSKVPGPIKEATLAIAALILLTGPVYKLYGNAVLLGTAFATLGRVLGVGGLIASIRNFLMLAPMITSLADVGTAAGLAGLSTSLATLGVVLAGIGLAAEVGAIAYYNYTASLEDGLTAQHNAKMAADELTKSLNKSTTFASNKADYKAFFDSLKAGIGDTVKDAGKLNEFISKLEDKSIAIGKDMSLDPTGKALLLGEIRRMVNEANSVLSEMGRDIKLDAAFRDLRRIDQEPSRPGSIQGVLDAWKAGTPSATSPTQTTKDVRTLKDAELKAEKKRLDLLAKTSIPFTGDERAYAEDVFNETQRRKDKIQADWVKTKAEREADEKTRAENAKKAAELAAKNELKILKDRFSAWNSFGGQVESVIKRINEVGAEEDGKAKWAAQAKMASHDFATIPPHLKAIVVGLAAINDEMRGLTNSRDTVREMFADMRKDALSAGLPLGDLEKGARFLEKQLDYKNRMTAENGRANNAAKELNDSVEQGKLDNVTRQRQIEAELKAKKNQIDGSSGTGGSGSIIDIARGYVGRAGSDAQVTGKAYGKEWCVGFIQAVRGDAGLGEIANGTLKVKDLRAWAQKNGQAYTGTPQVGDIATIIGGGTRHAALVSGVSGGRFTTIAGNEGAKDNFASRVKDNNSYSVNDPRIVFVRNGGRGSSAATNVSGDTTPETAPYEKKAFDPPATPTYKGNLMDGRISKGWGTIVTDLDAMSGEVRTSRKRAQEFFLNTEEAAKIAKDYNMSLTQFAAFWRGVANSQDYKASVSLAHAESQKFIRESRRKEAISLTGRSDAISTYLGDVSRGLYNFTPGADREAQLKQLVNESLGGSMDAARKAARTQEEAVRVRASGSGYLRGANSDIAGYERAQALEQARIINENSLKEKSDEIQSLREAARKAATSRNWGQMLRLTGMAGALDSDYKKNLGQLNQNSETNYDADKRRQGYLDYDAALVAQRETNELLDFQVDKLKEIGRAQFQINEDVEVERTRRAELKRLVDATAPDKRDSEQANNELKAQEAADAKRADIRKNRFISQLNAARNYDEQNSDNLRGLQGQYDNVQSFAADDPRLEIANKMLLKRIDLERSAKEDESINVEKRLADYREQLDLEQKIAKLTQSKSTVLSLQSSIFDQQLQRETALLTTAKDRLKAELAMEALKRRMDESRGVKESPEVKAARERLDLERQISAERADAMEAWKRQAGDVQDSIRGILSGDFGGLFKKLQSQFLDYASASLTNKILGDGAADNKMGGILDVFVNNRRRMPTWNGTGPMRDPSQYHPWNSGSKYSGVLPPSDASAPAPVSTGGVFDGLVKHRQTDAASMASSFKNALKTVTKVEIVSTATDVRGVTVNVAGGGTGNLPGLFGMGGNRGGGGSGTSETLEQAMNSGDTKLGA